MFTFYVIFSQFQVLTTTSIPYLVTFSDFPPLGGLLMRDSAI